MRMLRAVVRRGAGSLVVLAMVTLALMPDAFGRSQGQQAPSCDTPTHGQFDFWVGRWDVFVPNGSPAGTNVIEKKLNGCVLHEHWTGTSGSVGESFNLYRRDTKQWHQSWVDNSGSLLTIEGEFANGSMVLSGQTTNGQGQAILNRITWTPFTVDSVQQLWETSTDNGATWATAFDGRYVRAGR